MRSLRQTRGVHGKPIGVAIILITLLVAGCGSQMANVGSEPEAAAPQASAAGGDNATGLAGEQRAVAGDGAADEGTTGGGPASEEGKEAPI